MNNTLSILKLGNHATKNYWMEPQTSGAPPSPRYQHCMVHMPHLNLLVVHGGRTSKNVRVSPENKLQNFLNPNSNYKSEISEAPKMNFTLGDLYALKLDNLEWIKVISPNEDKLARSNH